jgi:CBS domain-containing protein
MKISKIMHRDVQIIGPEESLRNAAAMMKRLDAGVLPVSANDKLVGMITDRDIAIRGIAEGKGPDARVRDVMSHEVKYCFEDEEVAHVVENMAELQVRRLPVMNRHKRLVGIVSLGDLATQGSLPKTARALHGISQPGGSAQPEPCSLTPPAGPSGLDRRLRERNSDHRGPPLLGAPGGCFAGTARVDEVPLRRWTLLVPLRLRATRRYYTCVTPRYSRADIAAV